VKIERKSMSEIKIKRRDGDGDVNLMWRDCALNGDLIM
jgi:hypothetical protein